MQDLEQHRLVAGQRLVETDLALRYQVGRNAVREAMQMLAARGILDLSRFRSACIRRYDVPETMEVLDVAAAMTGLAGRAAAFQFRSSKHAGMLGLAMKAFPRAGAIHQDGAFSSARRQFYRALLTIGGNRELQRLFPAIGMHIIYSQWQSPELQDTRIQDYRAIQNAVVAGHAKAAERRGIAHVQHVRRIILRLTRDRAES